MDRAELGILQYWILGGLLITFFFNLPLKPIETQFALLFATFVNAVAICYLLVMNLVLLHGISAPFDLSKRWFYLPKLILIVPVFASMTMDQYFIRKDFETRFKDPNFLDVPPNKHSFDQTIFIVVMALYFIVLAYYGFLSLTKPGSENNEKLRFSSAAIGMTLFLTASTAFIVMIPFESQMLQFINEHGVINLFLIIISYLYAPSTEEGQFQESDEEPPIEATVETELSSAKQTQEIELIEIH